MKNKDRIINIIQVIIIIVFMIAVVPKTFQNDTFFTIALGERIANYGIEQEEKLAWHEGLEYTNSRWLFDIMLFFINSQCGFFGIYCFVIILGIIQALIYYYILNKITNKKFMSFLFTILIMYLSQNAIVARAQIISFTLFLIEFYCIEKLLETMKKRYFVVLIIIPIILVNTHASVFPMYFVFYLPYIVEFILSKFKLKSDENSKIIIERKNIKILFVLVILGFLLGFVCPKELEPYTDMFLAMEGISTRIITELLPINIINSGFLLIFIMVIIAIIGFTKTKVRITDCFFILGFTLMSLATYRCIYFFYYISTICMIRMINDLFDTYQIEKSFLNNKYIKIIQVLSYIVIISFSLSMISQKLLENYVDDTKYPVDASNYILSSVDVSNMKIYNHLNFGSYLEYKNIPVFIDSRTGMYTEEFNEGVTILKDHTNIAEGAVHYQEIFDKYEITHVLLYTGEIINQYICKDANWKNIYEDEDFVLYERINK